MFLQIETFWGKELKPNTNLIKFLGLSSISRFQRLLESKSWLDYVPFYLVLVITASPENHPKLIIYCYMLWFLDRVNVQQLGPVLPYKIVASSNHILFMTKHICSLLSTSKNTRITL